VRGTKMLKQITFKDIGTKDAFDVAFDYIAIVEKIQTWNISNDLNMIDTRAQSGSMTQEELDKFTFSREADRSQQVLRSDGKLTLGNRQVLVYNKNFNNGAYSESYRTWHIQSKNKDKKWYTSDIIEIHGTIIEDEKSQHDLTIKSNSRDLKEQLMKQKFPKKYSAPALFKLSGKEELESITIDCVEVARYRWQLQDTILDLGATFEGSGKVFITIPKGENNDEVIKTMKQLRSMFGFDSKASQDDSSYYIETSEYIFTKLGLTRFHERSQDR
jgi:hypothetical protein